MCGRFNATVKLNTAAILREESLFRKKQAEEAKLIQNYEEELRDSTEYYRWKTEMEEHDDKMKLEQVKLKRMQVRQQQASKVWATRANGAVLCSRRRTITSLPPLFKPPTPPFVHTCVWCRLWRRGRTRGML